MALLHIDGFDVYGSISNVLQVYDVESTAQILETGGRFSTSIGYLNTFKNAGNGVLYKTIADHTQLYTGFAIQFLQYTHDFLYFQKLGSTQLTLYITSEGYIQVKRGTTVLATSVNSVFTYQWNYMAIDIGFDNTTGYVQVWLNGVKDIDVSNIDTQNTASDGCDRIAFTSGGGNYSICLDDFYIADNLGSVNNTLIPEARVISLVPTADTSQKDFIASSGSDNYAMVDESGVDSDTTYVSTTTNGAKDIYDLGDLPAEIDTVYGISTYAIGKKDNTDAVTLDFGIKSGTVESFSTGNVMTTSYVGFLHLDNVDPNTSGAWSVSAVNALQCGFTTTI